MTDILQEPKSGACSQNSQKKNLSCKSNNSGESPAKGKQDYMSIAQILNGNFSGQKKGKVSDNNSLQVPDFD